MNNHAMKKIIILGMIKSTDLGYAPLIISAGTTTTISMKKYLTVDARYFPINTNVRLQEKINSIGIKSLFDPLDQQFFLLFLGPIVLHVYLFAIITVGLQVLNKLLNLFLNIFFQTETQTSES